MAKILKEDHVAEVWDVAHLIDVLQRLDPKLPVKGAFRDDLVVKHILLQPDSDELIDGVEFIVIEEK